MKWTRLCLAAIMVWLLASGCVRPAQPAPQPAPPATVGDAQKEIDSLKSQLEEAREELDSYKLRAQNWDYWQKIDDFLHQTLAGVSRTRGIPPPENIEMRVVTVDWAKKKWGDDYVRDSARKIQIDERIFKGLFIIPESTSLAALYANWPRSYLAAALGDKVYFVQENIAPLNGDDIRKVLAHEVVHLLQNGFKSPELATFDEDKAWAALVEGDADFTRAKYMEGVQAKPPDFGRPVISPPSAASIPETPPAFNNWLYFPYQYGQAFVSMLYGWGGWVTVDQAFSRPPAATAQIMHPDKYVSGQAPADIKAPSLNITGWQADRVDRLGEYFINVMLGDWLPAQDAGNAAQGWAGDRLTYYESEQSYLFTWQTAWSSEPAAAQFYDAFVKMLGRAGAKPAGQNLWQARGEYLSVTKTADRGILIIVSGDRTMLDAALKKLNI
ncbi:MAG: hypothetical protein Q7R57_06770 [Dehalococcoidales bacterium]|nr:hypothetical protein [Dehalococcoidales bacterium]